MRAGHGEGVALFKGGLARLAHRQLPFASAGDLVCSFPALHSAGCCHDELREELRAKSVEKLE